MLRSSKKRAITKRRCLGEEKRAGCWLKKGGEFGGTVIFEVLEDVVAGGGSWLVNRFAANMVGR